MNNITVSAVLVSIAWVLTAALASGQDGEAPRRFSFSVAPRFGMIYGQAEEIVYPHNTPGKYLSQLLWDMKPLWYGGARLDFAYRNPAASWGFQGDLLVKGGIPGLTGRMEDQDWQNTGNDKLTDYSIHDNQTLAFWWIESSAGIFIPIQTRYTLRLSVGASFMRFSFSAVDGYGTYSWDDPPWAKRPFSGEVIGYTQNWLTIAPGIAFDARFLERFTAGLSFQISPFIWCGDEDRHVITGAKFRDYTRWGLFLEPGGALTFSFNQRFAVTMDIAWRFITGAKGEAYKASIHSEAFSDAGDAGTGLSIMDAGLMFQIRF